MPSGSDFLSLTDINLPYIGILVTILIVCLGVIKWIDDIRTNNDRFIWDLTLVINGSDSVFHRAIHDEVLSVLKQIEEMLPSRLSKPHSDGRMSRFQEFNKALREGPNEPEFLGAMENLFRNLLVEEARQCSQFTEGDSKSNDGKQREGLDGITMSTIQFLAECKLKINNADISVPRDQKRALALTKGALVLNMVGLLLSFCPDATWMHVCSGLSLVLMLFCLIGGVWLTLQSREVSKQIHDLACKNTPEDWNRRLENFEANRGTFEI
jgi:hypothetical protein